jgi:hypothetical protein
MSVPPEVAVCTVPVAVAPVVLGFVMPARVSEYVPAAASVPPLRVMVTTAAAVCTAVSVPSIVPDVAVLLRLVKV